MIVSAAAVTAPLLPNLLVPVPEAKPVEEIKTPKKVDTDYSNPKCEGCQVCTIFFSDCLTLNNRVCWCESARSDQSVART
jgi:hypothetical protein